MQSRARAAERLDKLQRSFRKRKQQLVLVGRIRVSEHPQVLNWLRNELGAGLNMSTGIGGDYLTDYRRGNVIQAKWIIHGQLVWLKQDFEIVFRMRFSDSFSENF